MKKLLPIIFLLIAYISSSNAQNISINENGNTPHPSAILDISSTDKGILIPRTDTSLITNTSKGLLIYQSSDETFYYHNGSKWLGITSLDQAGAFENIGNTTRLKTQYNASDFLVGRSTVPVNGELVTDEFILFDKSKSALRSGGLFNSANWSPDSIGAYSLGFGYNVKAIGDGSIALGGGVESAGKGSFAAGLGAISQGSYSVALGRDPLTLGNYSSAIGRNVVAYSGYETVLGRFNTSYTPLSTTSWNADDRLFVIGNGTSSSNKSDAFTILKNGNATLTGTLTLTDGVDSLTLPNTDGQIDQVLTTDGSGAMGWSNGDAFNVFEKQGNLIHQKGGYSTDDFIIGREFLPLNGENVNDAFFAFDRSKGAFFGGLYNSTYSSPDSIGSYSFSYGQNSNASGLSSIALGFTSNAMGFSSVALGWLNKAHNISVAIGRSASSESLGAIAMGNFVNATNYNSIAIGTRSNADGQHSIAIGTQLTAQSAYELNVGRYNTISSPFDSENWDERDKLFVVGNGSSSNNRSDAFTIRKNGNTSVGSGNSNYLFHVESPVGKDPLNISTDISSRLRVFQNGSIGLGNHTGLPASNVVSIGERVGIRTTSPQAALHIDGDITEDAFIIEYENQERLIFTEAGLQTTQNIRAPGIADQDNNTKVQVEETANDNTIRFDINGTQRLRLHDQAGIFKMGINSSFGNTIIGGDAGFALTTSAEENTLIGDNAGASISTGSENVLVGYRAGVNGDGSGNTYLGSEAGIAVVGGSNNTLVGNKAGRGINPHIGSNNVKIGSFAGSSDESSDKLYIASSSTDQPLIYGEFDNRELEVNGDLTIDIPNTSTETTAELRFKYHDASRYSLRYSSASDYLYISDDSPFDAIFFVEDGKVGIQRRPTTNAFEVAGTASKSTAGDWIANSDARLKKNITNMNSTEILNQMMALQGITYEWNDAREDQDRPEGTQYGFTAQNIQQVFPELVTEDNDGYLQTAYGTYDAMYIESIRALLDKIEKLEDRLETLEGGAVAKK